MQHSQHDFWTAVYDSGDPYQAGYALARLTNVKPHTRNGGSSPAGWLFLHRSHVRPIDYLDGRRVIL